MIYYFFIPICLQIGNRTDKTASCLFNLKKAFIPSGEGIKTLADYGHLWVYGIDKTKADRLQGECVTRLVLCPSV